MILISKTLHPYNLTLHTDLNLFHQKYDSIWVEFKTSKNKTERSTLLNISYTPSKSNKIEFVDDFALSVDFAQSNNSNIVLLGDYNLNYLNTQSKQSLDTILTLYSLEVVNKTTPTCSKTLIDYFITDLNLTKLKIKVSSFTAPNITDHLATFLISELKLVVETVPIKRFIGDESNYSEKEFETVPTSINWESFYRHNNPEKMFNVFISNIVGCL